MILISNLSDCNLLLHNPELYREVISYLLYCRHESMEDDIDDHNFNFSVLSAEDLSIPNDLGPPEETVQINIKADGHILTMYRIVYPYRRSESSRSGQKIQRVDHFVVDPFLHLRGGYDLNRYLNDPSQHLLFSIYLSTILVPVRGKGSGEVPVWVVGICRDGESFGCRNYLHLSFPYQGHTNNSMYFK